MKRVRWTCPNGCPAVLGPQRPRLDDVARYCLPCSAQAGRLVPRTAAALEAAREKRGERAKEKRAQKRKREDAQEAAYYEVHGVDLRAELRRLWGTKIARECRRRLGWIRAAELPSIVVRTRTKPANRYGVAFTSRHQILVNRIPGHDEHVVKDTLAHELAHILTPGRGHDVAWRNVYRLLCEEAYGVRPRVERRYIEETHHKMRAAAEAADGNDVAAGDGRPDTGGAS